MEQTIKLILSILPSRIYRDFDHRFKLVSTEEDDLSFTLYIDVFPQNKVRVYYYGDNSLAITVHEEYWNGERYERFTDGGFIMDADAITRGKLESWFYRVFKLDAANKSIMGIEGIDQKLQLVFSALENNIMNDDGERYMLTVTVCRAKGGFGIDIHYLNVNSRDPIWLVDGRIMELAEVTSEFLKNEYGKEVNGFKPCRPSA